ncbi:ATP-binding protein (plasmid) [Azospirillum argentinense]|uniref:ATP-binding protein n=1 Tax=Azospirillum argentinense TaxID=2970906 RepID=A0A4D8PG90_9PROT|nr:ATP-binding protein [Azospirillum argentinense]QCN97436.1 ATP-binding protein [Azospirillum argentinense]
MSDTARIKPKDRDAILQALRAGVVPRLGLQHIQVGRAREVEEVLRDVERIGQGGAAIRFVIGEYGAGKTFFLNLTRLIGLEKRLVVINADLAPDRRLHASGGQARGLYAELLRNMATRTKPDGGALPSVVERFIGDAHKAAKAEGRGVEEVVQQRLAPLEELVSGFDFTTVLTHYWKASEEGSEAGKSAALRWLRAEYSTRTEARQALGVRDIIDDTSFYDYLKLLARFVVIAGYDGLLIVLDEMVNLYKLTSTQARSSNYEQILRILNDVLQGSAAHVGFLLGGTPEFLMDPRRGLYSYPALQSRLAENRFARDGLVDLSGPVIRLQNLTPEDLYVLLNKLRHIHAGGDLARHAVPDEALTAFMDHCSKRIGNAYFRTPRNSVTAFVDLLAVLEQNPAASWRQLLGTLEVAAETPVADAVAAGEDDELASFKL